MFCSNCGSKLPEGARFCSVCGARVAEAVEEAAKAVKPSDIDFSGAPATDAESKPAEAPLKTRVTFDWSNVIDEPQRKTVMNIKSPWSTTGSVDEKEIYSEMSPSGDRSRTMSFIDVLKAEKEQAEAEKTGFVPEQAEAVPSEAETSAPEADAGEQVRYTEVLDPGYLDEKKEETPESAPELHIAPLYDLDAPVVTPFDEPEAADQPAEDALQETPSYEEPEVEYSAPEEDEPESKSAAEEPAPEAEITIDEAAAAIDEEPETVPEDIIEEPVVELEPKPAGHWFDMPDFLKPKAEKEEYTGFVQDEAVTEPDAAETGAEAEETAPSELEKVIFEDAAYDEYEDNVEVTKYHNLGDLQVYGDDYEPAGEPESVEIEAASEIEEPVTETADTFAEPDEEGFEVFAPAEEPVTEAPAEVVTPAETEENGGFALESELGSDFYSYTEDEYLNIDTQRTGRVRRGEDEADTYDEVSEYEDEDFEDVSYEPVDENALFAEMSGEPKSTGMTIAAPADRESEIEALKRRLAELMGTDWEPDNTGKSADSAETEPEAEEETVSETAVATEIEEPDDETADEEAEGAEADEPAEAETAFSLEDIFVPEEPADIDALITEKAIPSAAEIAEPAEAVAETEEEAEEEIAEPAVAEAAEAAEETEEEIIDTAEDAASYDDLVADTAEELETGGADVYEKITEDAAEADEAAEQYAPAEETAEGHGFEDDLAEYLAEEPEAEEIVEVAEPAEDENISEAEIDAYFDLPEEEEAPEESEEKEIPVLTLEDLAIAEPVEAVAEAAEAAEETEEEIVDAAEDVASYDDLIADTAEELEVGGADVYEKITEDAAEADEATEQYAPAEEPEEGHGFEADLAEYLAEEPVIEAAAEIEEPAAEAVETEEPETDNTEVDLAEYLAEEPVIEAAAEIGEPVIEAAEEAAAEAVTVEPEAEPTIDDILAAVLREEAVPAAEKTGLTDNSELAAGIDEMMKAFEPVQETEAAAEAVAEEVAAEVPQEVDSDIAEALAALGQIGTETGSAEIVEEAVDAVADQADLAVEAAADAAAETAEAVAETAAEPVEIITEAAEASVQEEASAQSAEDFYLDVPTFKTAATSAAAAAAAEAVAKEISEVAAAEPEAPASKESDALTLEELEKDLFGTASTAAAEAEATKKIDKFYTLYRKNEEFQRLLDEEYNKLKAAGGPVPEQAIPDPEPPASAAGSGKMIEDATIYQDFELPKELIRDQAAGAAPAVSADGAAGVAAAAGAAAVAAGAAVAAKGKETAPEVEYEEVDKGGGFLTVLAVIVALILVILLAVILILQFAPDSGIALQINAVIENITSHFTALDDTKELLL